MRPHDSYWSAVRANASAERLVSGTLAMSTINSTSYQSDVNYKQRLSIYTLHI